MNRRDFLVRGNVILGSLLVGMTHPSTASTSIGTGSPLSLDIKNFGAIGDGVSDDTTAYLAALAALSDHSSLEFPAGTYHLNSATLAATPALVTKNNVTLFSNGGAKIVVTGTAACNIISCNDKGGFVVRGLSFFGNNRATSISNGLCLYWGITGSSAVSRFVVDNCHFDNFKGDYWISAHNAGTAKMSDVRITNNTFASRTGNSRNGASAAVDSACINIQGANNSATGTLEDIIITGNHADCTYIKSFVAFYASTKKGGVSDNVILNCGLLEVSDNCAAYGILVYDSSYGAGGVPPEFINISNNVIRAPRSCGIYTASTSNITITGNTISGQTDTVDSSLPKGAIALNGTTHVIISGNTLHDNTRGVSLTGGCANIDVLNNKITSSIASSLLIKLLGAVTYANILSNELNNTGTTSRAVFIQGVSSVALTEINIANNLLSGTYSSAEYYTADATQPISIRIKNNKVTSSKYGFIFTSITNALDIVGNVFSGNPSFPQLDATSSTKVNITDNVFEDKSTAYEMKLQGTQGMLWNNQFVRGAALVKKNAAGEDLGLVAPTWHAVIGTRVQCVCSGELGTSPNKYMLVGWVYSADGWQENRSLTGH